MMMMMFTPERHLPTSGQHGPAPSGTPPPAQPPPLNPFFLLVRASANDMLNTTSIASLPIYF